MEEVRNLCRAVLCVPCPRTCPVCEFYNQPVGDFSYQEQGMIVADAFPWRGWPRDAAVDTRK